MINYREEVLKIINQYKVIKFNDLILRLMSGMCPSNFENAEFTSVMGQLIDTDKVLREIFIKTQGLTISVLMLNDSVIEL